jgi:hypothetical protein
LGLQCTGIDISRAGQGLPLLAETNHYMTLTDKDIHNT